MGYFTLGAPTSEKCPCTLKFVTHALKEMF